MFWGTVFAIKKTSKKEGFQESSLKLYSPREYGIGIQSQRANNTRRFGTKKSALDESLDEETAGAVVVGFFGV